MEIDNFPDLVAQIEGQTLIVDFGPRLPTGVNLSGTPSITLTVADGSPEVDPDPQSRIVAGPVVLTAPSLRGPEFPNCAIAFRFGGGVGGCVYKAVYSCLASNGDTPVCNNQIYCYSP